MSVEFKSITKENIPVALEIYNWYVHNSTATFHLKEVHQEELERMVSMGHNKYESFIIIYNNELCGFCYISRFRYKEAYDKSAEITLYLKKEYTGKGIGKTTLTYLEKKAKNNGLNNLIAIITEGNEASITLFKNFKYIKVGHLKKIGEKFGKVLDVLSYQKEI